MKSPALPHLEALQPYTPGMSAEDLYRTYGISDAVKLASNENPYGPSQAAVAAMRAAATTVHRYPDATAHDLTEALAKRLGAKADELVLGHGSNTLIDSICRALVAPGDRVVSGDPSFSCYRMCAAVADATFVPVPLREGVLPEVAPLIEACGPSTKCLFIANPNNPTGTYFPVDALETLLRDVPEHVVVVVDEAYIEYGTAQDLRSAVHLRNTRDRLVVLRTFSKAYGLAGLRVGYGVFPSGLAAAIRSVRMPFDVGTLAQHAALASLSAEGELEENVRRNAAERDRVTAALTACGLEVVPSQGNFVLVQIGPRAPELFEGMLRQGVIVRPLSGSLSTCLRVSIGTETENDRLLSAVRGFTRSGL